MRDLYDIIEIGMDKPQGQGDRYPQERQER